MSEVLISPGLFMQENDTTQITQGPITVGAAIVGPTPLGPVNIPTVVTSYSQYKSVFGATFISGGLNLEYLTSIAALNYFEQGGDSLLVTRVASGSYTAASAQVRSILSATSYSFELDTLTKGVVMNNAGGTVTNGALPSGSDQNIRWEIVSSDTGSGTFSLVIRRGDDYNNNKNILETWSNLSLDPNQNNYISYIIGDQTENPVLEDGAYYLQNSGSYMNKSQFVRVKAVNYPTPNYFNSLGLPKNEFTASIPALGSGSLHGAFAGATGDLFGSFGIAPLNMFEQIPSSTSGNIQGLVPSNYNIAISLLANKDAYKFNVLYLPGLNLQNASGVITTALQQAQDRGDNIVVLDTVGFGQAISTVTSVAQSVDNSYGATYWPWLQIRSRETGKMNFVPASTIIPAVYEYNDKIAAEWWAPAGFNRGGLSTVLQPERKLSLSNRNALQSANVNPIASFPGVGNVIYGQKTLQKKASALDRVNVRRLLIQLKEFIGGVGDSLVFDPNTQVLRNRFIQQVTPYLEYVQQRQGLYAFQVIMDETNNTPDVIDRNQLVGTIYLQPTRAAEYIYLNFNITPTGTSFE
jgi:hypothetical protein